MIDNYFEYAEDVACPTHANKIDMDLCGEYQMQGNAEFVPRVLEEELAESWIVQCEMCENMHGKEEDPFGQPDMVLE